MLENTQVQELNGLITTVVSAPYSKELEEAFYIGSRDVDDNNIFWLYKVDKRTNENSNLIIEGTYVLFDELKAYDLIRDKRPSNATALTGINAILDGCRWQAGTVSSTHKGTANWYYVSRLEAFWEYLENWNVEFKPRMTFSKGKITGRYIDIVDKLSDDYGKWYEYGDKLLHITAEHASNSLYTAFIGRGKGEEVGDGYGRRIGFNDVVWSVGAGHPVDKPVGQDYVEIPQATELYGYSDGKPRTTVVTFEDTEDPSLLLEQTYAYALNECRPKLQMKADVLETGLSELGETCTIIRDDIGIRYKTRVFKLTRDFLNKNKKTVEFGDEIVQSTAKRNSNTAKAIKKQEEQTISWLESLHLQLQDTYFNEDGYNYELKADNEYELPGGYYSFNAPIDQNPTKVIYLGAGMLAIANSKNPDGSWRFRTWGTGDGFTADLMNTGTLNANNVNVINLKAENIIGQTAEFVAEGWNRVNATVYIDNTGINTVGLDGDGIKINNGLVRFYDNKKNYAGAVGTSYQMDSSLYSGVSILMQHGRAFSVVRSNSESNDDNTRFIYIPPNDDAIHFYKSVSLLGNPIYNVGRLEMNGDIEFGGGSSKVSGIDSMTKIAGTNGSALGYMNGSFLQELFRVYPTGDSVSLRSINMGNNDLKNTSMVSSNSRIDLNGENGGVSLMANGFIAFRVFDSGANISYRDLNMSGNNITNPSDRRLKKNIAATKEDSLSAISNWSFVDYEWTEENKPNGTQFGLIAQDTPELAIYDKERDIYSLNSSKQTMMNSQGVQQLNKKVTLLEKENESLKQELQQIKQHLGLA